MGVENISALLMLSTVGLGIKCHDEIRDAAIGDLASIVYKEVIWEPVVHARKPMMPGVYLL